MRGVAGLVHDAEDIAAIQRTVVLVQWRLAPLAGLEAPGCAGRNGGVEARDFERRVRRRGADTLLGKEPRGRVAGLHAEGFFEGVAHLAGLENLVVGLPFLAFVVDVAEAREVGLGLVAEEGVVEFLVVNVELAHLRLHALALFLFEGLLLLLLEDRVAHLGDARVGDELGELEWGLLDTALAGEILALEGPVTGNGYDVALCLDLDEQTRVG